VILEEINVKEMSFEDESTIAEKMITVDARKIGPRFGKETQEIIQLAKAGDFIIDKKGSAQLPAKGKALYSLSSEEFSVGYKGKEGFDVESEGGVLVSLDTTVTPALREEGWARDAVRYIQELRKKAGYTLSDRIYVYIDGPTDMQRAVTRFSELIARETLALEIQEKGDFEWDAEEKVRIEGMEVKIAVRK
jgi:isoleucyl-tRNA synthetase